MFENGTRISAVVIAALPASALGIPFVINAVSAQSLRILKIRNFFIEDIQVSGLVDIKFCGDQRPEGMIHPDTGNAVSVSDKVAVSVPDDGSVGTVYADTAKVFGDHFTYVAGIHQKQRETVLPEVAPSTAATAIVMVRQEGTAKQAAKDRLETDPFHEIVKVGITGVESYIDFFLPVCFGFC